MISIIFIILAAICNAVMDNLSHHFYKSIFNKKDQRFWNPLISCDCAKMYFGWKYDAWHVFKSLMVIFICSAICLAYTTIKFNWWQYLIGIAILGTLWNLFFNLFYNHLLNKK